VPNLIDRCIGKRSAARLGNPATISGLGTCCKRAIVWLSQGVVGAVGARFYRRDHKSVPHNRLDKGSPWPANDNLFSHRAVLRPATLVCQPRSWPAKPAYARNRTPLEKRTDRKPLRSAKSTRCGKNTRLNRLVADLTVDEADVQCALEKDLKSAKATRLSPANYVIAMVQVMCKAISGHG
jgi:hypothetical protein